MSQQHATNTPSHSAVTGLTIAATTVRQDAKGRYCLNDLHRAAGGENKQRPSLWVENQQTRDLIAEIDAKAGIPALSTVKGGNRAGTYVVKALVYAYAMWISPRFHLTVIEAYDDLVTGQVDHRRARHEAAASCKVMHAMLTAAREREGKATASHHYINEARLVNWALAGEFVGIDRNSLSASDLDLLAKLEEHNAVLIGSQVPYADRKTALRVFAEGWRTQRQPLLGAAA